LVVLAGIVAVAPRLEVAILMNQEKLEV